MRAVLGIAMGGADALAADRKDSDYGGARESAVLAALKLLRLGFERDVDVVQALRSTEAGALSSPLCCALNPTLMSMNADVLQALLTRKMYP